MGFLSTMGSVFYLLVHFVLQGEPEENLTLMWAVIQEGYELLGSENRFSEMRMTMFLNKSQPKLRGKAAEVKDMGPVALLVCKRFLNPNLVLHQKIVAVLEGIACIK